MPESNGLNDMLSSRSDNAIDQLYINMIEETYFKSPYVADSYKTPYNPDELYQKSFDYSIYEKMINDDQVSVCLSLKKDLILGDGANILAQDSDQDEIVEDLNKALFEDYEGNFVDDLEEILTSYEFGFSITEKIFKIREGGYLGLKSLKTRHPNSWLIYQDVHGNIEKFEQKTSDGSKDINKNSIIHFINNKRFQNPYGNSDLRAAYNAWLTKLHVSRFFSIYLEKAASPIPVGRYDKNSPKGFADTLLNILKKFQTKTAISIPKEVEIEFLEAKSNGEAYHKAIHLFNMIIGRSLFVPDLVGFTGSETGGGSLALGKEQMNLFFMHIIRRRNSLEETINREIIKPIINYNFGFMENMPKFKFKQLDESKSIELAKIWLEAIKGNAYQPNKEEINHFRNLVKFPEGDVEFKQIQSQYMGVKQESNLIDDKEEESKITKNDKKEFAKAYDQTPGDFHKKVNFKAMKNKLDDYDKSLMNESSLIVSKMIIDLKDQIEKKKIVQNQNVDRIDTLSLKYKKELKQVFKNSFHQLYKDSIIQAKTEVTKSNFAKPLEEDKWLEVIDQEVYNFIGDFEYTILKKTRVELIAAVKDGKPLSSVLGILDSQLKELSEVQLERYARTKHTEVMNNGRHDYFESTGVVTGYQYSAIMDERTSEICSGLHGKFFKSGTEPIPPMHFNCRSTLIPITKYEEFKPTESIQGMSPEKFIEEYKGQGFSKFESLDVAKKIDYYYEPKVGDEDVEFETEIINDNQESIKYYWKGLLFKETIITYGSSDRIKGDYVSIKHKKVLNNEK